MSTENQVSQAKSLLAGYEALPVAAEGAPNPPSDSPIQSQVQEVRDLLNAGPQALQEVLQPPQEMQERPLGPQTTNPYLPVDPPPEVVELERHKVNWMQQAQLLEHEMSLIDIRALEEENPGVAHRVREAAAARQAGLQQYFAQIQQVHDYLGAKFIQMEMNGYGAALLQAIPEWRDEAQRDAELPLINEWLHTQQGVDTTRRIDVDKLVKLRKKWLKASKAKVRRAIKRSEVAKNRSKASKIFANAENAVAHDMNVASRDRDGKLRIPPEKVVAEALRNL